MHRRAFLIACACGAAPLLLPRFAHVALGSTSRLLTLEELTSMATYVVAGTAREQTTAWVNLPSGRRIVTYTRLTVEQSLAGDAPSEISVRTLGGAVGKIGQSVAGEARLVTGGRSVLFLTKVAEGDTVAVVTAMAQGHYPLVPDAAGVVRLAPSPDTDLLVAHPGPILSARERLIGSALPDAAKAVAAAYGAGAK